MTAIYCIRHGATVPDFGPGDASLSAIGVAQATKTARWLESLSIAHTYSSPLLRAQQTATIIAKQLNGPLTIEARLRERMNWGDIEGQSFGDFVQLWEQCSNNRTYIPLNGCSANQTGERLAALFNEIVLRHGNTAVVLVTHGGILTDYLLNRFTAEQLAVAHAQFPEQRGNLIVQLRSFILQATNSKYALLRHRNISCKSRVAEHRHATDALYQGDFGSW